MRHYKWAKRNAGFNRVWEFCQSNPFYTSERWVFKISCYMLDQCI